MTTQTLAQRARDTIARTLAALAPPPPHQKAHRASPFVAIDGPRTAVWAPRDYAAFAREGFMQNAIVYRSVRMIAESVGNVPLLVYDGSTELTDHQLATLLRQPNPTSTSADLLETLVGFLLVSGNAYLEAVAVDNEIRELHALRPDRMTIIPGPDGWPEAYSYSIDGRASRIEGEAIPGVRKILHIKLFHPVNDHYGMSPIEAAASAIDLHNTAAKWNKALLDNSARPSGALVYTARDGNLTSEQYDRLKRELESGFQGAIAAGRPLLLEGGLDWKSMSLTPKDMDFLEAKNAAAREIALALGIPPVLIGIPGDNTYSNYQEANRALWRQTVLPLVNRITAALSGWLGEGRYAIRPDLDAVDALNPEREALWTRLDAATFLTPNEKRDAAGYDRLPGNDEIKRRPESALVAKFDPSQPRDDAGRWTTGDGGDTGDPNLVSAFLGSGVAATVEALLSVFTFLSGQNSDDQTAVLSFRADEFLPGGERSAEAIRVGSLSKNETDAACPRHGEVQSRTDEAVIAVRESGTYTNASEFGTKVHSILRTQINELKDPNFRAEVSAIKSREEGYGTKESIRVDILEEVGDGTVCVYDIKTGKSRLSPARMAEIANNVHSLYTGTRRILVIEARPRQ